MSRAEERYEFGEVLHVGSVHTLRRALDRRDGTRVILKCLDVDAHGEPEAQRLRREFERLRELDLPGVIQARELLADGDQLLLVLSDAQATNLTAHLQAHGRPSLVDCLDLAVQLADTLAKVHAAGVIHRDIKPRNILIDAQGRVQLIDFGIAIRVSRDAPTSPPPSSAQGTLAYISPEQSGRLSRGVDHRSDLYSLGATLFELLVGRPPFLGSEPAELIHAHIARLPPDPCALDPSIPPLLAAIVLRLLAKAPEDRYRSAFGLAHDLRRVRAALVAGEAPTFALGGRDPPLLFRIPDRVYGRDAEAAALDAAIQRIREGAVELVLVRGQAGAGRAALVRGLRRAAGEARLLYAAGKSAPGDVPYAAFCEAFDDLLRGLALEGPEAVARWRHVLTRSLGAGAAALVPLIPELGALLGLRAPESEPDMPPEAARARLHRAIHNLVRAFARRSAPLVLHLDDLQAADPASIELLVALLGEVGGEGFGCVATCREAPEDGPVLADALRRIANWCRITTIELGPLPPAAIAAMIADTLALPLDATAPLAALVAAKTHGSPLFAAELLRVLHDAGVIRFDADASAWTFDLRAAAAFPVSDNVVEFLLGRLRALPPTALAGLQRAACVGDVFRPDDLELDDRLGPAALAEGLAAAAAAGLVEGLGERLGFAHGRVREAVYATIDPAERPALHRAIARRWRARAGDGPAGDPLFAVAEQTILGAAALADGAERRDAAELVLRAAVRARGAGAFASAVGFARHCLEFMGEGAWSTDHALVFRAARLACEAEFIGGDLAAADAMMRDLLGRCADDEQRADVLTTRLAIHLARGEHDEVIRVAREVARMLGDELPRRVSMPGLILAVIRAQRVIGRRTPEALVDLPPLRERRAWLLQQALTTATGAAFQSDLGLLTLLALKSMVLAVRHGLDAIAAPAFVIYGIAAGAPRRDYALMDAYGRAALKVVERFPDRGIGPLVQFLYSGLVQPMKHPYRDCIAALRQGQRAGLDAGLDQIAGYCTMAIFGLAVPAGLNLDELRGETAAALPALARAKLGGALWNARIDRGFALAVLGESRAPGDLSHDGFDEAAVAEVRGDVSPATRHTFLCRSLLANLVLGRLDVALQRIREADPGIEDTFRFFNAFFEYRGLRALALAAAGRPGWLERRGLARELRTTLAQLDAPARACPANFAALRAIVAAELARLVGDPGAPDAHERAIELAREHGAPHLEGLACERAARYYLERGAREAGHAYVQRARRAFHRWGAKAKVALLDQEFAGLRGRRLPLGPASSMSDVSLTLTAEAGSSSSSGGGTSASSRGDHLVDIASVVKAAQVFAAEIDLKALSGKLMRLVVENAGAERGVLLLHEGGGLAAITEYSTRTDTITDLGGAPIEGAGNLPVALIDRALRGGKAIALEDAAADPGHAEDSYVRRRRVRSAFAAPLIVQTRSVGVIYLENNLAAGVFNEQRLEVLQILAVQAAIAVEHAGYFRRLDAARAAAEAASVAKSQFLANMSHELRTPLNAIIGYAELVQEEAEAEGLDAIVADLARIREAGAHLLDIIGGILDLTKIESGTLESRREAVVVEALLDEVAGLAAVDVGRRDNRLVREQGPGLGVILSDASKLRQILVNLLANAAKFTERGVITLRAAREGDALRLEVEDTGIGISEDHIAAIFEPFTQVDPTSTRRYGGVGLGLTISRRLCELLGGKLTVRSTPGQGSTFRVTLPATARA